MNNFIIDFDETITNEGIGELVDKYGMTEEVKKMSLTFTPKKGIEMIRQLGLKPIIITGRQEYFRDVTEQWLHEHYIPYSKLIMLPSGYYGKPGEFDWNKYVNFKIKEIEKIKPLFVLDDVAYVTSALNKRGIPSYLVKNDFGVVLIKALRNLDVKI